MSMIRNLFVLLFVAVLSMPVVASEKQVLFIEGGPSHSFGEHEHLGGSRILAQTLEQAEVDVSSEIVRGWPDNADRFAEFDTVVVYGDGGDKHPLKGHIDRFQEVMDQGTGLVLLHYAVQAPEGKAADAFAKWVGGYYEYKYSVNPMWTPKYDSYPDHPVTNGVKPFSIKDEWYFNIRLPNKNITPLLTDEPSDEVREGPYVYPSGPYDHIVEASGETETMAWALERENGGRSFGFTGGHFHWNWGQDDVRRLVANAILWSTGADVPKSGVSLQEVTVQDLLDVMKEDPPGDFDAQKEQKRLDRLNDR